MVAEPKSRGSPSGDTGARLHGLRLGRGRALDPGISQAGWETADPVGPSDCSKSSFASLCSEGVGQDRIREMCIKKAAVTRL